MLNIFVAGDKIWHETRATSNLRPEAVVWQMVRFFASQEDGLIGQVLYRTILYSVLYCNVLYCTVIC